MIKRRIKTIEDLGAIMKIGFEKVDKQFEKVDKQFEKVDEQFKKVDKQFEKVDKQFEKVDKQFANVDKQFANVDKQFENLAVNIQKEFLLINGKLDKLQNEVNSIKYDLEDLKLKIGQSAFRYEIENLEKRLKIVEIELKLK